MGQAFYIRPSMLCDAQLEVLNTLEKNDVTGQFHCVSLQEWFEYRGHVCMAFERLGLSLYDFLRRSGYLPFQVNLVGAQRSVQHALALLLVPLCMYSCTGPCMPGLHNSLAVHRSASYHNFLSRHSAELATAGAVIWAAAAGERGLPA